MLYHNPFARKPFVIRLFTNGKFVQLTLLFGHLTIPVKFFYSKISEIGLYQNRFTNGFPDGFLKQLKIMDAPFCLSHVYDFFALPFNDYLCFYGVTLLFA